QAGFAGHCVVGFGHGPWIGGIVAGRRVDAIVRMTTGGDPVRSPLPVPAFRSAEKTAADYRQSRPDKPYIHR
ncbi:hypothetical protein, partial [Burkholderia cenocepacia]|uniref:hypothetical protein n=1 Tax=Burkholderia cenocepacia TaxID=95486 RepID=UPI0019553708